MEQIKLSEEPLAEGCLALIEVGKKTGKYIIGKVVSIQRKPEGDTLCYHERYWNKVDEAWSFSTTKATVPLSQCARIETY